MSSIEKTIKTLKKNGAREPRIIIMGAGMSGILMGINLVKAGLTNFKIYEKRSTIGGTWRENTYPGIACDIASYFTPTVSSLIRIGQGAFHPALKFKRTLSGCLLNIN